MEDRLNSVCNSLRSLDPDQLEVLTPPPSSVVMVLANFRSAESCIGLILSCKETSAVPDFENRCYHQYIIFRSP